MHPHAHEQSILDTIRFAGAFIFLADLMLKVAYFRCSKFVNIQIRQIFAMFFLARPAAVVLYHAFAVTIKTHKLIYYKVIEH